MQETTIRRNMINITEVLDFRTAEQLLKELEIVVTEIEEIVSRRYKQRSQNK